MTLPDSEEERTLEIHPDYVAQQKVPRTEVFAKYKQWLQQNRPSRAHDQSARNFYATLTDLEMPLTERKTSGTRYFTFVPREVYQHLLRRRWTERDANEEDVPEESVECLDEDLAALFEI